MQPEDAAKIIRGNLMNVTRKLANYAGTIQIPVMVIDFFKSRLPPVHATNQPIGPQPLPGSKIQFIYPDHILICDYDIYEEEDEDDENEEDLEEEEAVDEEGTEE